MHAVPTTCNGDHAVVTVTRMFTHYADGCVRTAAAAHRGESPHPTVHIVAD